MYNQELAKQVKQQGASLTAEENQALYLRLRTGDKDARERMITGNMPLVVGHVNKFITERMWLEYLRDDLTSAGFLGLVGAINNLVKRKEVVEEPNAYLIGAIWSKLFDTIEQEQNVGRPRSGGCARRNGSWILPCTVSVNMENLPVCSEINAVDLRDFIDACCHSDLERQYIRLKEAGYSYKAIGCTVHSNTAPKVSAKRVERAIHRIEAEVQQEYK